jgi:hypothetical protein
MRKRLLVDKQVQWALIKRFLFYWVCILVFVTMPIAISQTLVEPSRYLVQHYFDTWRSHWPILATLTVLLPFVLYDILKISHRFAGPIFRLRRELQRYVHGEEADCVRFRDGDFWPDLGDNVTALMERVHAAEKRVAELERRATAPIFPGVGLEIPCDEIPSPV